MPEGRAGRARRGVRLHEGAARLDRPLAAASADALGTDGFGRSENRAALREFFEVDYRYVVVATLAALARDGKIDASVVAAGDQGAQHQSREGESGDLVDDTTPTSLRRAVTDFTLPELGENIAAGDVLRVLVKPATRSRRISRSSSSRPTRRRSKCPRRSPATVKDIKVKAGDKVKVGQAILSVEDGAAAPAAAPQAQGRGDSRGRGSRAAGRQAASEGGSGRTVARRRRQPDARRSVDSRQAARRIRAEPQAAADAAPTSSTSAAARAPAAEPAAPEAPPAPAAPSVRRMARELGVDINEVPGTGPDGRISIDDVKAHAQAAA